MSADEQTTLATAPTEPAPALAPIVVLHPDGVVIREDIKRECFWLCVRRDGRTGSEMLLTAEQLRQARTRIDALLGDR